MFWTIISAIGLLYVVVLAPLCIRLIQAVDYERTGNFLWFCYGGFLMYIAMLLF